MHKYIRNCTLVYLTMILLTIVTWYVGSIADAGLELSLMVLLIAMIKGQLVGDFFMGLRTLNGIWRWVVFIWLFIPGALITTAFVTASRA